MDKDNQNFEEVLTSLGYKLSDRGSYWQTSAVYRNGDNNTAIQIYKDTGIWKDYVQQTAFMPFEKLLKITLGTDDDEIVKKYYTKRKPFDFEFSHSPKKIKMEKIYPDNCLERLLPHYKFYNNKGISSETLKVFQGGLATEGKMYQRFVFPIYNLNNKIHGFSGRDMIDHKDKPKWKHIGVKSKWIYPNHISKPYIDSNNEVILVESIGDMLNLFENGIRNTLCTFGVDISPSLISYLVGLSPKKIFISFNNDSMSSQNAGLNGALKNFIKLQSFIDYNKIFISLPQKNDFGDMDLSDIHQWTESNKNIEKQVHDINIIKQIDKMLKYKKMPQTFFKKFKKFKNNYA
jgi:hypothetical protein